MRGNSSAARANSFQTRGFILRVTTSIATGQGHGAQRRFDSRGSYASPEPGDEQSPELVADVRGPGPVPAFETRGQPCGSGYGARGRPRQRPTDPGITWTPASTGLRPRLDPAKPNCGCHLHQHTSPEKKAALGCGGNAPSGLANLECCGSRQDAIVLQRSSRYGCLV